MTSDPFTVLKKRHFLSDHSSDLSMKSSLFDKHCTKQSRSSLAEHLTPFRICVSLLTLALFGFFVIPPIIDDSLSPWLETKLSVTTLHDAELSCLQRPQSDIVVTMTTLPKRIDHIHRTVKTILLNSVCPAQVLIWVPTYNKRLDQTYALPDWLLEFNRTSQIVHVYAIQNDLGPATKLVAALQNRHQLGFTDDQRFLVIDDDVLYSQILVQTHDCWSRAYPNTSTGIVGCDLKDRQNGYDAVCNRGERISTPKPEVVLFGTASILTRPRFFNLTVIDNFLELAPAQAHFEDDWYFSTLMSHQNISRMVVPIDRRQLVQMDTLWTKRGALMDTDNDDNSNWRAMIDYWRATHGLDFDAIREALPQPQSVMSEETLHACLAQTSSGPDVTKRKRTDMDLAMAHGVYQIA